MTCDQILAILRRHANDLRRLGAARLFLFGSASRNDAGPESDVDLFFDFDDPRFSIIELVALQDRISQLLNARADVMSRGSLHPRARASIEGSAVRVF
jgi:predicted nucleotidyltransferase